MERTVGELVVGPVDEVPRDSVVKEDQDEGEQRRYRREEGQPPAECAQGKQCCGVHKVCTVNEACGVCGSNEVLRSVQCRVCEVCGAFHSELHGALHGALYGSSHGALHRLTSCR